MDETTIIYCAYIYALAVAAGLITAAIVRALFEIYDVVRKLISRRVRVPSEGGQHE